MIWLYRILFLPVFLLVIPYYGWRMIRRGGYGRDFSHRFGGQKNLPKPAEGKKRVWIQAVSVGEVEAIAPLLEKLHASPRFETVVTTTTSTAYQILRQKYAGLCLYTGIFPLDFWPFSRRAWLKIKPDVCILMESELWPEHLHQARTFGAKLMLINARMSDRSFARYSHIRPIAKTLLSHFDTIAVSTKFAAERLLKLGAAPEKTFVSGNLKFDTLPPKFLTPEEKNALRAELGFGENSVVMLGSSTWAEEEKMLVNALKRIRARGVDCRLLLVPRHAERRAQILPVIEDLPHHVRSVSRQAPSGTLVYLADTTGELRTLTQAADFAFVGKSLPPNDGGQTPIECACLGVAMCYGPNMTNFRRVCQTLERCEAAIRVKNTAEAIDTLERLSATPALRKRLAENAKIWHKSNEGATARTLEAIEKLV